mmetsp:Transcript_1787/g.4144  ORF Transcript_1787/g.4144 Transcript_1787/m.4144 type:complete len:226 (-) Transcript_1787:367-1044(-)
MAAVATSSPRKPGQRTGQRLQRNPTPVAPLSVPGLTRKSLSTARSGRARLTALERSMRPTGVLWMIETKIGQEPEKARSASGSSPLRLRWRRPTRCRRRRGRRHRRRRTDRTARPGHVTVDETNGSTSETAADLVAMYLAAATRLTRLIALNSPMAEALNRHRAAVALTRMAGKFGRGLGARAQGGTRNAASSLARRELGPNRKRRRRRSLRPRSSSGLTICPAT